MNTPDAPRRLPVLLLHDEPDAAAAVARWRAGLPAHGPLAWLRNGFLMPARPREPGDAVIYEAGAACACCVGLLPMRLALARLLRDAARHGGWSGLVVELGPRAHPDTVAALLATPPFDDRLALPVRPAGSDGPTDRPAGPIGS